MFDVTKSFKSRFEKSAGWCDYEVVACDGWFFSSLDNFGIYSEDRRDELISCFKEVNKVGCKGRTTAAGIYIDFHKDINDDLGLFEMFFEITQNEYNYYGHKGSEHRYLSPIFSYFVNLMEEGEEKSILENKILTNLYKYKSYDFSRDVSYYCEYNAWTTQTNREEGGLSESLEKNLRNKISWDLSFLNEEKQKELFEIIFDDCLERLKINFKREENKYDESLRTINYDYERKINESIQNFLV